MYIYTLKGWYEMNRTYELLRQEHQLFLRTIEALDCYKQAYKDFERVSKINRVMSLWSLTAQEHMDKKYYSTLHAWVAKVLAPISTRVPCKRFTKARIIFSRADKRARRVLKKYYQYKSRVYESFVKFFTLYLQYKAVRKELDRLSTTQKFLSAAQQHLRLYF